jgi:Flp pilus assembly protein TadD
MRQQAGELVGQGRPEAAARVLERGLRIAPKDGWLWSDLAEIRLNQGRFDQAATMARKAGALARNNPALRERTRRIIQAAGQKKNSIQ